MNDDELLRRIDELSCSVPGDPHAWRFEDLVFDLVKRAKRIADMWDGYGGQDVEIHWREFEALNEVLAPFVDNSNKSSNDVSPPDQKSST